MVPPSSLGLTVLELGIGFGTCSSVESLGLQHGRWGLRFWKLGIELRWWLSGWSFEVEGFGIEYLLQNIKMVSMIFFSAW